MPDTDKILEAEQSIQSLASELKRMRDAANLLQGSQSQLDAVLTSAQKVMQATEKFSGECGVIVTKLAATFADFEQIAELLDKHINASNTAIAKVESHLDNLANQLQSTANSSKARQITTLVLLIINFVVALVILAKTLMPSLGG
ncbi:MAG TPA: hypothetical protein VJ023_20750 [Pyrinomonadaceae bacterium]|nr:hypothetical protein [Pyrinomonadaceae bacterium]